jgi:hypothetical protein
MRIEDFRFVLRAQLNRLRDLAQDMRDVGWTLVGSDQTDTLKKSRFANDLFQTLL